MGREGYSSQTSKKNFVHDLAIALLSGHTHTQKHSTDCLTRTTAEAVAAGARQCLALVEFTDRRRVANSAILQCRKLCAIRDDHPAHRHVTARTSLHPTIWRHVGTFAHEHPDLQPPVQALFQLLVFNPGDLCQPTWGIFIKSKYQI